MYFLVVNLHNFGTVVTNEDGSLMLFENIDEVSSYVKQRHLAAGTYQIVGYDDLLQDLAKLDQLTEFIPE